MTRSAAHVFACLVALSTAAASSHGRPGGAAAQPPSEMVHIDGKKNPEMIPEWVVWEVAFEGLHGATDLPTVLYRAGMSKEEAAVIKREAEAAAARDRSCKARAMKLAAELGTASAAAINQKTSDLQLECRQQTIDARDRLLAALGPQVQAALAAWVEDFKQGMTFTIARGELAHFRKPQ